MLIDANKVTMDQLSLEDILDKHVPEHDLPTVQKYLYGKVPM